MKVKKFKHPSHFWLHAKTQQSNLANSKIIKSKLTTTPTTNNVFDMLMMYKHDNCLVFK
jgi:hypothetical protein